MNPFKKDGDRHEFRPILAEIEEQPASPLGHFTFWLVIGIVFFFIAWAIFGQIDVVISARGKVIPYGKVKFIQPLEEGVISQILVKEGDFVKKGEPLVIIDPATTAPELASSQRNLAHLELERARLKAAANGGGFGGDGSAEYVQTQQQLHAASVQATQSQLRAKAETLAGLDAQISAKKVEIEHTQATLAVNRQREARLREVSDIIAKDDYEKVTSAILADEDKLRSLNYEIAELNNQKGQTRSEMGYIQQNFRSSTLTDLSDREKQISALEANVQDITFKNARQTLTAPVDGYVNELAIHTVGGVVTPAQKVLSIVPVNTPLVVEATVLNKDIGFVKSGMPVTIKIDTFDFQKYGTIDGKVSRIPKDSRDDEKLGPVYTVAVTPLDKYLVVEGKKEMLTSGLSLTAEIKVGKRRIIEFFIYPLIKHLNEGMSVR